MHDIIDYVNDKIIYKPIIYNSSFLNQIGQHRCVNQENVYTLSKIKGKNILSKFSLKGEAHMSWHLPNIDSNILHFHVHDSTYYIVCQDDKTITVHYGQIDTNQNDEYELNLEYILMKKVFGEGEYLLFYMYQNNETNTLTIMNLKNQSFRHISPINILEGCLFNHILCWKNVYEDYFCVDISKADSGIEKLFSTLKIYTPILIIKHQNIYIQLDSYSMKMGNKDIKLPKPVRCSDIYFDQGSMYVIYNHICITKIKLSHSSNTDTDNMIVRDMHHKKHHIPIRLVQDSDLYKISVSGRWSNKELLIPVDGLLISQWKNSDKSLSHLMSALMCYDYISDQRAVQKIVNKLNIIWNLSTDQEIKNTIQLLSNHPFFDQITQCSAVSSITFEDDYIFVGIS